MLQLFESYVTGITITKDNIEKILSPTLIALWISQLSVQNKYIRKVAESIRIDFGEDGELAFDVLRKLHKSGANLGNINQNHPLYHLLQMV